MDLPWGDERTKQFVTNVGLITSNGPYEDNIMACEWTHHISYSPGLIAVCIRSSDATHDNIKNKNEFGVNLCASDQNVLSSIAGGNSGKSVNKIEALKEIGFKFFKAKKIDVLMVEGASLNVECKLIKTLNIGSHVIFIGEVAEAYTPSGKEPLIYHNQKYWKLGSDIPSPDESEMNRIKNTVDKYKK